MISVLNFLSWETATLTVPSHASLLISNGASIVSVAKRLGHNDIEQTLNTYAHMMPKEDDYIINILEKTANNLGTNLGTKN